MAEIALVAPIFMTLLFGIFELGLLLRNDLTLDSASLAGARAASVSGNSRDADFLVLRAIDHTLRNWDSDALEVVVVYRATGPDDTVPAACLSAPVANVCNHYRPADFDLPYLDSSGDETDYWGCGTTAADDFLCPADRPTDLDWVEPPSSPFNSGPAYIGVYLEAEHEFATKFFLSSVQLSENRVLPLEPRRQ